MGFTQQEKDGLYEITPETAESLKNEKYYNDDMAPAKISERKWSTVSITYLWIGLSVSIPALALSSSLIALGVSPLLAILNVFLGNLLISIPMQLNSRVGTKYGIPYPICARLTFGAKGAQIPSILRSIVGCGWSSIQSWVCGVAIAALIALAIPGFDSKDRVISLPGNDAVNVGQLIGFFIFMIVCGIIAYKGMDKVRWLQNIGGPVLIIVMVCLFGWSMYQISASGHNIMEMFMKGNNDELLNQRGGFWFVYLAGLTANVSFWSTMAVNMSDFSRYAKNQKSQLRGQLIGMPIPMLVCAFVGACFAFAMECKTGTTSFDPSSLLHTEDNKIVIIVCAIGIIMATLTTNIAANIVPPSNGWSNLAPKKISFKKGVIITIIISSFVLPPWFLYGSGASYMFLWIDTIGIIIAPIVAILCADYFINKKQMVDLKELYMQRNSRYEYINGWNIPAVISWLVAFLGPMICHIMKHFVNTGGKSSMGIVELIDSNGYIISFATAFLLYILLSRLKCWKNCKNRGIVSKEEHEKMTKHL